MFSDDVQMVLCAVSWIYQIICDSIAHFGSCNSQCCVDVDTWMRASVQRMVVYIFDEDKFREITARPTYDILNPLLLYEFMNRVLPSRRAKSSTLFVGLTLLLVPTL